MNLYMYSFIDKGFAREDVTKFLDTKPNVTDWFYCLPDSIFIRTSMSGKELSNVIEEKFGNHRHFIAEVSDNRWGRLPKDHWDRFP